MEWTLPVRISIKPMFTDLVAKLMFLTIRSDIIYLAMCLQICQDHQSKRYCTSYRWKCDWSYECIYVWKCNWHCVWKCSWHCVWKCLSVIGTSCLLGSCLKSARWTDSKTCKWRINFHYLEKSQRLHAAENGTCRMLCVLYFLYSVFSLKLTLCKIRPNLLEFLAVGLERVSIHSVVCQMTNWILHRTQALMGCGRGWGGQYLQH